MGCLSIQIVLISKYMKTLEITTIKKKHFNKFTPKIGTLQSSKQSNCFDCFVTKYIGNESLKLFSIYLHWFAFGACFCSVGVKTVSLLSISVEISTARLTFVTFQFKLKKSASVILFRKTSNTYNSRIFSKLLGCVQGPNAGIWWRYFGSLLVRGNGKVFDRGIGVFRLNEGQLGPEEFNAVHGHYQMSYNSFCYYTMY